MTLSSNFVDFVLFLLSSLVTGPSFMSISSLVLEFFYFIRDWPEIPKLEIPLSEFCVISGDWGELGIPDLVEMYLIKCYWMLQNTRATTFTVSELLRESQRERGRGRGAGWETALPASRLGLKCKYRFKLRSK